MPKRKLDTSEAALQAIKQAHQRGWAAAADVLDGVTLLPDLPHVPRGVIVREGKQGEPRYYLADQAKGPGRTDVPRLRHVQELERDAKALAFKRSKRQMPIEAATQARQSAAKRGRIEQAWRTWGLDSRHAAKQIAYECDVSAAYVRKVRTEMRLTDGKE